VVKRRPLSDGLKKPTEEDRKKELAFVFGKEKEAHIEAPAKKPKAKPETPLVPTPPDPPQDSSQEQPTGQPRSRSPLTTKLRTDMGDALKRASLERQLAKQFPFTIQDILELVLEPWLKDNGFLK
jgi:hypothetical protein